MLDQNQLNSYLADAEKLIDRAADCLGSFFIAKDDHTSPNGFVGFMRDSLISDDDFRATTGGVSIVSDLYRVDHYLSYLHEKRLAPVDELRKKRNLSQAYIADAMPNTVFKESDFFRNLSPLTFAVYASVLGRETPTSKISLERFIFFNAVNLWHFLEDDFGARWPVSRNVGHSHPFLAYKVQAAVISLMNSNDALLTQVIDGFDTARKEFVRAMAVPAGEKQQLKELLDDVKLTLSGFPSAADLRAKVTRRYDAYRDEAESYLLSQLASIGGRVDSIQAHHDDPVGACCALQILLLAFRRSDNRYDLYGALGQNADLIQRSLAHILNSLDQGGSFPFGAPFSYTPSGFAGFTTSTNGLSTISHFLVKLLYNARKLDYPNKKYFERMLFENFGDLEKLLDLLSLFASTKREATVEKCSYLKAKRTVEGWSTDRAKNHRRLESWVTVEPLLFGIYAREMVQEALQFQAIRRYSAFLPKTEPQWPYKGLRPVARVEPTDGKQVLLDPDGNAAPNIDLHSNAARNSPVQYLHSEFSELMVPASDSKKPWNHKVSSILLVGPPGTAKTTTVRSLAQSLNWHFLEITPGNFVVDGLEKIEQRAQDLFNDLAHLRETVVFFDELDSLFSDRERHAEGSMMNFVVPAMLPKIQKLNKSAKSQRLLIVIATNFYDRLDPAMVRAGRIDRHLLVLPYNKFSKLELLKNLLGAHADILDNAAVADDLDSKSSLYVFEELKILAGILPLGPAVPDLLAPGSIGPDLYVSRIPAKDKAGERHRGTVKLGLEVAELLGRELGEERKLECGASKTEIINRLAKLSDKKTGLSGAGDEWVGLCSKLLDVLKSV